MSEIAVSEESLQAALGTVLPERDPRDAVSLGGSVVLHALVVTLLLLGPPLGMGGTHGTLQLVPIEFVSAIEAAARPAPPKFDAAANGEGGGGSLPARSDASGVNRAEATPAADPLQKKLHALALLRQPDSDPPPAQQSASTASASAASDNAAPGRLASLKDSIRVQVERHWSFNLASLGTGDISVPIEVDITNHGNVLKAEILGSADNPDPAYHDIAMSARNAVLLASPLTLPEGDYDAVMHLVLYLNPRRALQ